MIITSCCRLGLRQWQKISICRIAPDMTACHRKFQNSMALVEVESQLFWILEAPLATQGVSEQKITLELRIFTQSLQAAPSPTAENFHL